MLALFSVSFVAGLNARGSYKGSYVVWGDFSIVT